jgi:hypothetical protein
MQVLVRHLTFIVLSILLRQVAVGILLAQILIGYAAANTGITTYDGNFAKVCRDRIIGRSCFLYSRE